MSNLQTIIDQSSQITFKHKRVAGQSVTRSGRLLTGEVVTAQPYILEVLMHSGLKYSESRSLLAEIDRLDITVEDTINVGNTNPGLAYITSYMGDATPSDIANITVVNYTGNTIYLNTSNTAGGSGSLFRAGDRLQPTTSNYRYTYTVTQDVAYAATANVPVPVHRNVIAQNNVTLSGSNIRVGSDCEYTVKMRNKPTYSVLPGGRLGFDSSFELVEVVL